MRPAARVALGLVLVLLAVLLGVWVARKPIASDVLDRELARRGVPARYTVGDLNFGRQRLTNVVIGDPARPDLVADWVELRTAMRLGTPEVTGVRAGHVRLRARLVDGRMSLGALDRLLPEGGSGQPFALPAIDAQLGDVRVRLEAPGGVAGLRISGRGRLNDGFRGSLAGVAERWSAGGCTVLQPQAVLQVRIARGAPAIEGPVRARALRCGEVRAGAIGAQVRAQANARLEQWQGRATAQVAGVAHPAGRVGSLRGEVRVVQQPGGAAGRADIAATAIASAGATVAQATLVSDYRFAAGRLKLGGARLAFEGARLSDAARVVAEGSDLADGTPVAPLARRLAGAVGRMAGDLDGEATGSAIVGGGSPQLLVTSARAKGPSGETIALDGARVWVDESGLRQTSGTLRVGGGELPQGEVTLAQAAPGAPITGVARFAPYVAGTARLALTSVRFSATPRGNTRWSTAVTLSGPLADGHIERATVPMSGLWDGRGAVVINPDCAPVSAQRVKIGGAVLGATRLTLCPLGAAMLDTRGGRLRGGVRSGAARLAGTIGGTPLVLALRSSELNLGTLGFGLAGVDAQLGYAPRISRLTADRIDGRTGRSGASGTFAGATGQVGAVPLALSNSSGRWSFANGRLDLRGGLTVSDAQTAAPRFRPLVSDDVALSLRASRIEASGSLSVPAKGARVANVRLSHDLSRGSGAAVLDVPGLRFGDALQPSEVTPLTFGVIADVRGEVRGQGEIAWSREGVTSRGSFGTSGLDFAAAFGPVTGFKTDIAFTDLLGLVSAPAQVATVAQVNPGVPVENGTLTYQLIGEQRIAVAGARWPFAGGALTLEPTTLAFGAGQERRLTFRVQGVSAAQFLQQFEFENLNATGTFDGVLPMIFDERGGRIADGHLIARTGGNIAYVGEISERDVGFWGNLAFQALRSLDYRSLDLTLNGPLAGEMVTAIRFAGVSQGKGAKSNFLIRRLARLPFVFNVTVRAPFRQLIDSVRSYYEPSRLIERNLPALLEEERRRQAPPVQLPPVQPSESETRP
jgi:translocation and assembly module TamB